MFGDFQQMIDFLTLAPFFIVGAFLTTFTAVKIAQSGADIAESERRDFHIYLDEFQTFTTLSIATMLSELRKYRTGLVLAHQYLSQLDAQVRDAIWGNAGTIICFRVGKADAQILEKEFPPELSATDLMSLSNYNIYLKLMVDGTVSRPFSAQTIGH